MSWDLQFTQATRWNEGDGNPLSGRSFPLYGRAVSCTGYPNAQASINLSGTGVYIPSEVNWRCAGLWYCIEVVLYCIEVFC